MFYSGRQRLQNLRWHQADRVNVRFSRSQGDQNQAGNVTVRLRDEVKGTGCSLDQEGLLSARKAEMSLL